MEPNATSAIRGRKIPISPESKEIECICLCTFFFLVFLEFELVGFDETG